MQIAYIILVTLKSYILTDISMCVLKYFNIRLYETLRFSSPPTEPCGFFYFMLKYDCWEFTLSLHRKHLSFMLKLGFENLETSHFKLNINYAVLYFSENISTGRDLLTIIKLMSFFFASSLWGCLNNICFHSLHRQVNRYFYF